MSRDDIPTLTYAGKVYRLPFKHLFRDHSPDEERELRQTISRDGVHHPVLTYDSDTWGPDCVISGRHRLLYAEEMGFDDVPVKKLPDTDDETAHQLALCVQIAGRQLTAEDIKAARAKRVETVAELRAAGMSMRAIAAEVGVSPPQVLSDIHAATVKGLTVEPDVVIGVNGKTYQPTAEPKMPAADRALADLLGAGETEEAVRVGGVVLRTAADPAAVAEALFTQIEARVERAALISLVRGWLRRLEGETC